MKMNEFDHDVFSAEPFPHYHSIMTVKLGELIEHGVFDWSKPILDWSDAAYSAEQYERVCTYFIERFRYCEISLVPFKEWATLLHARIVYELCPVFNQLYDTLENGFNPLAVEDEYYKERVIGSEFPETLLSGNSTYASDGRDREYERIRQGDISEQLEKAKLIHSIDQMFCDRLETFFNGLYTMNANVL